MYRETEIAIICPNCGSEAIFHKAFDYVTKDQKEEIERSSKFSGDFIECAGGYIYNKYPRYFVYPQEEQSGMVICDNCAYCKKHGAISLDEYYYQIFLHEKRILAFNREQMMALYEYVGAKHRDMSKYTEYYRFLYNIPRFVYFKKNRDKVIREIKKKYL